jgi:hypothetical protein
MPPQLSKEVLLYPVDFLTVSVACSALMIVRTTIFDQNRRKHLTAFAHLYDTGITQLELEEKLA